MCYAQYDFLELLRQLILIKKGILKFNNMDINYYFFVISLYSEMKNLKIDKLTVGHKAFF